ncbi:MAG: S8 family serine peptidase, partial [Verrucomicrobiales bacterium]|nr:S8 family serine peptidase [Verrucomicrobiales bacterium]
LENRSPDGQRLGPDTNPREAWSITRGEGVTLGIGDDGFEVLHPDLREAAEDAPHYDFTLNRPTPATYGSHATSVAGLVAARGDNQIGVTGIAPRAKIASLVIWNEFNRIVSDERLMDMFQYEIHTIGVQNHSWGNASEGFSLPSDLEAVAISNAVTHGRGGLGVVMVRSAGNGREDGFDTNDDAYPNDPRVIAVAAIRRDGRVASYSNPGACLLVGAPSGDSEDTFKSTPDLFTTDRVGSRGYNAVTGPDDLADYAFGNTGFSGTSASSPEIAGLTALLLSANPSLTVRDVQQILVHSSIQTDLADPFVTTNGAGYVVSHNQGFGMPDAGLAVRLAKSWSNRPPVELVSLPFPDTVAVPDDGLKVWLSENGSAERAARCFPSLGPHADAPTSRLPLVYVGLATNTLAVDLHGKAALIQRGENFSRDKIAFAARAGAAFAVIFNQQDGDALLTPAATDFDAIPAVVISENEGRALVSSLESGNELTAQLRVESASLTLAVTNTLVCEHVGLRVRSDHTRRGDLRITLVSPSGTRSILQRRNNDRAEGPEDWTYWSVQHFGEPATGTWTALFADELLDETGSILGAELVLRGTPITDSDADGLDDAWERFHFGDLSPRGGEDPDHDGRANAAEQLLRTTPKTANEPLLVTASRYSTTQLRLAWPSNPSTEYEVLTGIPPAAVTNQLTRLAGDRYTSDLVVPLDQDGEKLFQLQAKPR